MHAESSGLELSSVDSLSHAREANFIDTSNRW